MSEWGDVLDDLILQPKAQEWYGEQYWWALYQKGIIHRRHKEYDQAETVLWEVYNFFREKAPGKDYHASALHQLGVIDLKRGRDYREKDYTQAKKSFDEAEKKFLQCLRERRYDKSNYRLAHDYRRLAQVYALTHRSKKARECFYEAIAIAEDCHDQRYVEEITQDIRQYCAI